MGSHLPAENRRSLVSTADGLAVAGKLFPSLRGAVARCSVRNHASCSACIKMRPLRPTRIGVSYSHRSSEMPIGSGLYFLVLPGSRQLWQRRQHTCWGSSWNSLRKMLKSSWKRARSSSIRFPFLSANPRLFSVSASLGRYASAFCRASALATHHAKARIKGTSQWAGLASYLLHELSSYDFQG